MKKIDIHLLNDLQRRELREAAWDEVSGEHSLVCVCGRLCSGFHESSCGKFRAKVEKRFLSKCEAEIRRLGLSEHTP